MTHTSVRVQCGIQRTKIFAIAGLDGSEWDKTELAKGNLMNEGQQAACHRKTS
jgi:hypothetical protein